MAELEPGHPVLNILNNIAGEGDALVIPSEVADLESFLQTQGYNNVGGTEAGWENSPTAQALADYLSNNWDVLPPAYHDVAQQVVGDAHRESSQLPEEAREAALAAARDCQGIMAGLTDRAFASDTVRMEDGTLQTRGSEEAPYGFVCAAEMAGQIIRDAGGDRRDLVGVLHEALPEQQEYLESGLPIVPGLRGQSGGSPERG
jgi:hypothetical protein